MKDLICLFDYPSMITIIKTGWWFGTFSVRFSYFFRGVAYHQPEKYHKSNRYWTYVHQLSSPVFAS